MKKATIPDDVRRALAAIVEYDCAHELEDYADNYPECQGDHIFESLVVVENWLNDTDVAPEAYLEDTPATAKDNHEE
jgi:hypothetical protein